MGLGNQKCDRCQEFSEGLFRLPSDLEHPAIENPWYCINCCKLMGEPLDRETLRMFELLRDWSNEH